MRTKHLVTLALAAGVLIGWLMEVTERNRLQTELAHARERQHELAALRDEQQWLQTQQPSSEQLAALRAAADTRARLVREIEQRSAAQPRGLHYGDWTPHSTWQDRGAGSPRAAVESALWAAAGGDVSALAALVELEPAARERAAVLYEKIPAEMRRQYTTPEALLASLTLPNIPRTEAQLVWSHVADERASIGVLLQPESSATPPSADKGPEKPRMVTLKLHRTEHGWRLVLPARAVDRMAATLATRPLASAP